MSIAATRFAASPAVAAQGTRAARFALVLAGCFIGFLGVTYLQRIGYVVDRTSQVPISVLTTGLALATYRETCSYQTGSSSRAQRAPCSRI